MCVHILLSATVIHCMLHVPHVSSCLDGGLECIT